MDVMKKNDELMMNEGMEQTEMQECVNIIVGANNYANELRREIEMETSMKIEAFATYRDYKTIEWFEDLKIDVFEDLASIYPQKKINVIVAIGYSQKNKIREKVFFDCKQYGYNIIRYISPRANVYTTRLGEGTIVRAGAHVGVNVILGDGCIVNCAAVLTHDIKAGKFNFFGARSCFGGGSDIGDYCFFGLNSTIKNRLHIADFTLIGAGANVIRDTESNGTYVGNPAKILENRSEH